MSRTQTITRGRAPSQPQAPTERSTRRRPVALHGFVSVIVTTIAVAVLHILEWHLVQLVGVAGLGLVLGIAVVVSGVRANLRGDLIEQLRRALVPIIGDIPAGVSASRWSGVFEVGYPRVLCVRYVPSVKDDSPEWRKNLMETVERRLLVEASLKKADTRRCRWVLDLSPPADGEDTPAVVERAELVVSELFGAAAKVAVELDGEQELQSVRVSHEMRTRVATASNRMRIERVFSAMLPERWRAKWDLTEDVVTFERRPHLPTKVDHVPEPITEKNRHLIPIAIDEDGQLVRWNLKGSGPHWMVVGRTGSGKTVAINGGVMEFCRRGWPVWIVDPKRIEFMGMRNWPNVQIVATTVVDQLVTIKAAHDLMEERYALIEAGADESDFEPLVLVLDEFRNFHRQVSAWYAGVKIRGMPAKCQVFDWIAAIAEKGRSAGIHIILGTQRPDADFMTGSMRDNFDTRTSCGPLSPQGAQMMWDSPYLGVAVPRKIRGRGTAINEAEVVSEVQILWTPDPRRAFRQDDTGDLQILQALRPAEAVHEPLEVDLGHPAELDEEWTLWDQVLHARLMSATGDRPRETQPVVTLSPPSGVGEDESDVGEDLVADAAESDGYGMEISVRAAKVEPGDLVLVDESLDLWAAAEAVEEDLLDDEQLVIDWRSVEDEESGSLSLTLTEMVTVRRPEEEPGAREEL